MDRKLPTKHLIVLGLLVTALSACDEAPEVRAALSLELDEMVYELRDDDRNTYHHTRRFVESAGIGVTLTKGVVCVEERCVEAKTNYRIEPNAAADRRYHHRVQRHRRCGSASCGEANAKCLRRGVHYRVRPPTKPSAATAG